MKLFDTLLIAVGAAFFAIGVYQVIQTPENNIAENYWIFMISFICLFLLGYRKLSKKKP